MAADPATMHAMAQLLLTRADDLHHVGVQLADNADSADWHCAKADRFRAAMQARRTETLRLAIALRDLGRWAQAQAVAATPVPAGAPASAGAPGAAPAGH